MHTLPPPLPCDCLFLWGESGSGDTVRTWKTLSDLAPEELAQWITQRDATTGGIPVPPAELTLFTPT